MLKTIEEPPPRTIVLLVTAVADDLLPTIRSRCQRIDFDPVADDALRAALERDGVDAEIAATAPRSSGGQLARARALAGPLAPMRAAFAERARPGSTAPARPRSRVAELLGAAVDQAADAVTSRHERGAPRLRRRARTPRLRRARRAACCGAGSRSGSSARSRRTRIDLLLEGVTAIESVYRDVLADPAPPLNGDRPRLVGAAARRRGRARRVPRGARGVPDQREGTRAAHAPAAVAAIGEAGLIALYAVRSVAGVAQTVEQLTRNEQARSSSLLSGSRGSAGQPQRGRLPSGAMRASARARARTSVG